MNLKSSWSALGDFYDILGGYGFAAMDKAATEMELTPDWSTWLFAIWLFGSEPITTAKFQVTVLLNTPVEVNYYRKGGVLHKMLRKMVN